MYATDVVWLGTSDAGIGNEGPYLWKICVSNHREGHEDRLTTTSRDPLSDDTVAYKIQTHPYVIP